MAPRTWSVVAVTVDSNAATYTNNANSPILIIGIEVDWAATETAAINITRSTGSAHILVAGATTAAEELWQGNIVMMPGDVMTVTASSSSGTVYFSYQPADAR